MLHILDVYKKRPRSLCKYNFDIRNFNSAHIRCLRSGKYVVYIWNKQTNGWTWHSVHSTEHQAMDERNRIWSK